MTIRLLKVPLKSNNDFPHKTNEWLTEEKEISVVEPEIDPKTKKVSYKKSVKKVTEKVYYASGDPKVFMCTNHSFIPADAKKYTFKCLRCQYHFRGFPPTHKYDPETKKLYNRATGEEIKN